MSTDKTPLQQAIKEAIEKHPTLDDKEIAQIAFESRYPNEKWDGKDPSFAYVGKMRSRIAQAGEAPIFTIEEPDEPETPETPKETPEETQEPETPFQEDFEPPDFEDPEIEFDPVDGFTLDDTEFILCFTFDKFADWSGWEGWSFKTDDQGKLIDRSEKRFAGLTHRMMEKYMPDLLDQYFLEFMFCYTGIMLLGSKTKDYLDWRRRHEPVLKDVESTVVEEPPSESVEASEIPDIEAEETSTKDEPLPVGAKAHGETEFTRRIRRQTP